MKMEKDKITVNYEVMICFDIFRFDSGHKFYNLHTTYKIYRVFQYIRTNLKSGLW